MSTGNYPPPPDYNSATQYGQGPPTQFGVQNQAMYPPPQGQYPPPQGAAPPPQSAPQSGYGYNQAPKTNYNFTANENPDPDHTETAVRDSFGDYSSFSDKAVRRGFIRKVYLILAAQLVITFGIVMLFSLVDAIKSYIQYTSQGAIIYYVSYATFFVTYFVLICIPSVRRNHPGNLICLGVFTLAFSYMVGMISSFYTTYSVIVAAGITTLVCLSISLFAIQTKIDFTMCSGLLFALVMVLFMFGISCIIVYATVGYNRILDCVWGGLAALVFSLFLIYDTQMIVGGRKHELSPEEYVYGALQLYIDVVYLFLIILSLFGKSN